MIIKLVIKEKITLSASEFGLALKTKADFLLASLFEALIVSSSTSARDLA